MGTVFKRKDSSCWWIGFKNSAGLWEYRSSGVKDKRLAQRALEQIEEMVARRELVAERPTTVRQYAEAWAARRDKNVWTSDLDLGRLKKHLFPHLGARLLVEVSTKDIRGFVDLLRAKDLAPRSIRNIVWATRSLFEDACAEGLIPASPVQLRKGDVPRISDKDPKWRQSAVFARGEAEQLFSACEAADHRTLWAMAFLAGMRLGEISALRWRDYDTEARPLGCITVSASYTRINGEEKATKTETPRLVPVHPTLAAILSEWRLSGWCELIGRMPTDNDLVLPNRAGRHLTDNNATGARVANFAALTLRHRRFHDARRTFISLAQVDGALPHVLKLITHGKAGEVMDLYTTLPWATLCEAVKCLKLKRRARAIGGLPTVRPTIQKSS